MPRLPSCCQQHSPCGRPSPGHLSLSHSHSSCMQASSSQQTSGSQHSHSHVHSHSNTHHFIHHVHHPAPQPPGTLPFQESSCTVERPTALPATCAGVGSSNSSSSSSNTGHYHDQVGSDLRHAQPPHTPDFDRTLKTIIWPPSHISKVSKDFWSDFLVTDRTLQRLGFLITRLQLDSLEIVSHHASLGNFHHHFWAENNGGGRYAAFGSSYISVCRHFFLKNSPKREDQRMWTRPWFREQAQRVLLFWTVHINLRNFGLFAMFATSCLLLRAHPSVVCRGGVMLLRQQGLTFTIFDMFVSLVVTKRQAHHLPPDNGDHRSAHQLQHDAKDFNPTWEFCVWFLKSQV